MMQKYAKVLGSLLFLASLLSGCFSEGPPPPMVMTTDDAPQFQSGSTSMSARDMKVDEKVGHF